MNFTQFCVGLVICILLHIISGIAGLITSGKQQDEVVYIFSWVFSTIGFGICLTILLYQNGIIK